MGDQALEILDRVDFGLRQPTTVIMGNPGMDSWAMDLYLQSGEGKELHYFVGASTPVGDIEGGLWDEVYDECGPLPVVARPEETWAANDAARRNPAIQELLRQHAERLREQHEKEIRAILVGGMPMAIGRQS